MRRTLVPYGRRAVTDGSDDGCGHDRADAGNLADTRTSWIAGRDPFQFIVQFFDLLLDKLPLTPQHVDQVAHPWCQVRFGVLQDVRHGGLEPRWLLCKHHPAFKQKCPQLVDHRRTARDQPIPNTMDRLQVQLIVCLDRNKAHVLPFDSFGDGLCIDEVVLFDFTKGFTN